MSAACERVAATLQFYEPDALPSGNLEYAATASEVCDDPYVLVAKAATGDIQAQRNAADMVMLYVLAGRDSSPLSTLREGILFARMAASRGESDDIKRLIYMLSVAGTICLPEEVSDFAGEMLALFEVLADRGDETRAELLPSVAEGESAETMAAAQEIKARIVEAWGLE